MNKIELSVVAAVTVFIGTSAFFAGLKLQQENHHQKTLEKAAMQTIASITAECTNVSVSALDLYESGDQFSMKKTLIYQMKNGLNTLNILMPDLTPNNAEEINPVILKAQNYLKIHSEN